MSSLRVPDARDAPRSDLERQHNFPEEFGRLAGRLLQRLVSSCTPSRSFESGNGLQDPPSPSPAHLEGTAGLGRTCSSTG